MKTKELATDELLKAATPRPWKCNVTDAKSGAYTFSQADAHLLVRATNSFEAMREALRGVLDNEAPCTCTEECDGQCWHAIGRRALALAEGKAVKS